MLRSDVGRERERNVEGAIKRKLFVCENYLEILEKPGIIREAIAL